MKTTNIIRHYDPNPTAVNFHLSDKTIRCYRGPVGNGKSVACIQELRALAQSQYPNSEGIRKSRAVIVRNTYPELKTTTLNTFKQWFPGQISTVVGSPIITAKVEYPLEDGTRVEMEAIFLSMNTQEDVSKLLSLECSFIFLNEARELPYSVIIAARERIGRYPAEVDGYTDLYDKKGKLIYNAPKAYDAMGNVVLTPKGGPKYEPCRRKALIMDTNSPDDDHWWYHLEVNGCLPDAENPEIAKAQTAELFDFFSAPGGLIKQDDGTYIPNPDAENIDHLPGGYQYYLDMIAGNKEDHINVMVLGNFGVIFDGKLVYGDYSNSVHCAEVKANPDYPIALGWDFGHTPACVIGQYIDGQMRILAEIWSDDSTTRAFARDQVRPFLQRHFMGYRIAFSMADPAGNARGEGEGRASIAILNDKGLYDDSVQHEALKMGFTTRAAPTNDPTQRVDAVSRFMLTMSKDGPGYLVDPSCKRLVRGKMGGYHYRKVQGKDGNWKEKPNKNKYSHIADAEQYLALGFHKGLADGYAPLLDDPYDDPYYGERASDTEPDIVHNCLGF